MFAIAGVTGNTGKVTAHTLLSQGKKVRVIVRDAAKGKEFADKGAEVAIADLGDAEALAKALTGVSGAYLLVPPAMVANFKEYQLKTGAAIAAAVTKSKVPHVVFLSSVGADLPSGTGPIEALYQVEKSLREISTTKTTFLRAGYFIENLGGSLGALAQNILPGFFPLDLKIPFVATKDIGEAAAKLLAEGPFAGVVEVSSQVGTWSDAAAALSNITGKTITPQAAPLEAMIPTLKSFGFSDELAGMYHEMTSNIIAGKIGWGQGQRHVKGNTSIETVLRGLLQK
jgi:NAD(P)H dehydrogenase (quinone)